MKIRSPGSSTAYRSSRRPAQGGGEGPFGLTALEFGPSAFRQGVTVPPRSPISLSTWNGRIRGGERRVAGVRGLVAELGLSDAELSSLREDGVIA